MVKNSDPMGRKRGSFSIAKGLVQSMSSEASLFSRLIYRDSFLHSPFLCSIIHIRNVLSAYLKTITSTIIYSDLIRISLPAFQTPPAQSSRKCR